MDTDPRPDLTAGQRIAIALGTAEPPPAEDDLDAEPAAAGALAPDPALAGFVDEPFPDSPA